MSFQILYIFLFVISWAKRSSISVKPPSGIRALSENYCSIFISWIIFVVVFHSSELLPAKKSDDITPASHKSYQFKIANLPQNIKAASTRSAFVWRLSSLGLDNSIMSDMPVLSQSTKELLVKVRMIVPPMLDKFHKGFELSTKCYAD